MVQHYILYRDRTDVYLNTLEDERRRLIAEGRVPRIEDDEEIAR
jgi:cystinosin